MKELVRMPSSINDFDAIGTVTINFTDPVTQRIKEQIKGNNHVFKEVLFGKNWDSAFTDCPLCITDNNDAIESDFPYMKGKLIGYGNYLNGSSGNSRGAYDAGNSWVNLRTPTGISNKYTYQFTPTQALGTLGQIGLSCGQFHGLISGVNMTPYKHANAWLTNYANRIGYQLFTETDSWTTSTSGGRFIQKYTGLFQGNELTAITNVYDASSLISATNLWAIRVTRDSDTGKFYIVHQTQIAVPSFVVYEFSDSTFGTLLNTYTIPYSAMNPTLTTDITNNSTISQLAPCAVRNGRIFFNYAADNVFVAVRLTDGNTIVIPKPSLVDATNFGATYTHWSGSATPNDYAAGYGSYCNGKYYYFYAALNGNQHGCVLDLDNMQVVAFIRYSTSGTTTAFLTKHPYYDYMQTHNYGSVSSAQPVTGAVAANIAIYQVPVGAPTRPAGYGMTITYELEILY